MEEKNKAANIIDQMFTSDAFSQWLGIERIKTEEGHCILSMKVREEMLNGFNIAHGGITYSLADSALAFASNSSGMKSVSIETAISHLESVFAGDILTATATEIKRGNRTGWYDVTIKNQNDKSVAVFRGTVYRSEKEWIS